MKTLDEIRALDAAAMKDWTARPNHNESSNLGVVLTPGWPHEYSPGSFADAAFIAATRSLLLPLAERVAELEAVTSTKSLLNLQHYDELMQQYIVERDLARKAEERNAKLEAVAKEAEEAMRDDCSARFTALRVALCALGVKP